MDNLQDMAAAPKMVYYARRSRELGKMAAHFTGNEASNILAEKTAMDVQVFALLEKTANRLLETYESLKKIPGASTVAKGLGYGLGAAVPLGLMGNHLINNAEEKAKGVVYPAAGVLGAGAGLMALSNMVGDHHDASSHGHRKQSAEDTVKTGMAAYAVADKLRNVLAGDIKPEMRKLAQDTLSVALAHVADIVGDIVLSKEAGLPQEIEHALQGHMLNKVVNSGSVGELAHELGTVNDAARWSRAAGGAEDWGAEHVRGLLGGIPENSGSRLDELAAALRRTHSARPGDILAP